MIRDLMDASALESHRLSLSPTSLDLIALVRELVARIPNAAERVAVRAPDEPIAVDGDPVRLEQVFANLVSNALKYGAPDRPVDIEIRRAGPDAVVAVTNEGAGIPPDEAPHVFERYVRTRGARAGRVTGTGLGLYIARGLVEAHGGRIEVESVPGAKTTFRVSLPAQLRARAAVAATI
jgi:signal transduction histidine kinase